MQPQPQQPQGAQEGAQAQGQDPQMQIAQEIQAMPREELEQLAIQLATEMIQQAQGAQQAQAGGAPGGGGTPPM